MKYHIQTTKSDFCEEVEKVTAVHHLNEGVHFDNEQGATLFFVTYENLVYYKVVQ